MSKRALNKKEWGFIGDVIFILVGLFFLIFYIVIVRSIVKTIKRKSREENEQGYGQRIKELEQRIKELEEENRKLKKKR